MLAYSNCGWGDITFCSENTALIIKLVLILHEGAHYVLLILALLALLEQFMVWPNGHLSLTFHIFF